MLTPDIPWRLTGSRAGILPWDDPVVARLIERPADLAPALLDGLGWPGAAALLLLVAAAVGLAVLLATSRRGPAFGQGPYAGKSILTPNELEFYHRLVRGLPGRVILCQVSMSALIVPRDLDEGTAEYMRLRSTFAQKYVDFVICNPRTLEVIAIVELDDVTHDPEKDARRDAMLNSAGYPVVRWHSRRKPTPAQIGAHFQRLAGV